MSTLVEGLNPTERRAVALVGLMLRMHGGKEGEGLFTGVSRYQALEQRIRLSAERARTVRECWDRTARMLNWNIGPGRWDAAALALIAPGDDDTDVLRALSERSQSIVMIARHLARQRRAAGDALATPIADAPAFDDPLDIFDIEGDGAADAPEVLPDPPPAGDLFTTGA